MRAIWSEKAKREFDEILSYIMEQSEQNARLVSGRVDRTVRLLCSAPALGRPIGMSALRVLIVPKTPYLLTYRIGNGQIEIVSLRRGARKPEKYT